MRRSKRGSEGRHSPLLYHKPRCTTSNNVHKIFQGEKQGIYSKKKREGKIKRKMMLKRKPSVKLPPPDTALIALVLLCQPYLPRLFKRGCGGGASLAVQWLRICLLMQGTRVRALVWEDPTCRGATRPVSHNY